MAIYRQQSFYARNASFVLAFQNSANKFQREFSRKFLILSLYIYQFKSAAEFSFFFYSSLHFALQTVTIKHNKLNYKGEKNNEISRRIRYEFDDETSPENAGANGQRDEGNDR